MPRCAAPCAPCRRTAPRRGEDWPRLLLLCVFFLLLRPPPSPSRLSEEEAAAGFAQASRDTRSGAGSGAAAPIASDAASGIAEEAPVHREVDGRHTAVES